MSIEDTIRQVVHEEVRTAVREEIRAVLAELKPSAPSEARLTVERVAELAGNVKPGTVRDWIKRGKLQAERAGHRYLITKEALTAFLASSAATPEDIGADEHLSILLDRVDGKSTNRSKKR